MSLLDKFRLGNERGAITTSTSHRPGPVPAAGNVRRSNGLKDFLWLIGDVRQGRILDLGPVWQSTVGFFTERGFRVTTEDLLRAWVETREQEERLWASKPEEERDKFDLGALGDKFLEANLVFPSEAFHGVLAWDLFDYLPRELLTRVVPRIYDLLKPGGALLAAFHSSRTSDFHRYRILDHQTVELVSAPVSHRLERIFQNREILSLLERFRSSRTFVGRDQLREALFTK